MPRAEQFVLRPLLLALCAAFGASAVRAQSAPPAGSPADVRYTPLLGPASRLSPQRSDDAAPRATAASRVARIVVEVDRAALPADGQSRAEVTLRLLDRDGRAVDAEVMVTIEHSGGRLLLGAPLGGGPQARPAPPGGSIKTAEPQSLGTAAHTDEAGPRGLDADRLLPGVQVRVEQGRASFALLAPHEAQDVRLRVTAGDASVAGTIAFVPDLRPMIAAGLIEGIVTLRHRAAIQPVRRGDGFEQEISAWSRDFDGGRGSAAARAALFLKGTIRGDMLLTAAYDSDKETRARLLRDIRPDELYPVYGDASLRSFDARSGSRLYLRLDKNRSYLLWGDFVTGDGFSQPLGQGAVASLKQRSLGTYNRSATGARLHHEQGGLAGNLFVFKDSLRQVVEEFASQGSGPYGLRNGGVLEGSEKLEIVVRDRQQPARIVAVTPLVRLVDYSFEPFSGRILLGRFLSAVDDQLNPVSLRVTYEVDQGGTEFWVAGGDLQVRVGEGVEVGGSAVHDRNPLAPYRMQSANAAWQIGLKTALVVEAARTRSEVNTNAGNASSSAALAGRAGEVDGQAWRAEFAHSGERVELRAFVGASDTGFNNPAAPLHGGRGEAWAAGRWRLAERLELLAEGQRSEDRAGGGGTRSGGDLGLRLAATEQLSFEAGIRSRRERVGLQANGVSGVPFGSTLGLGSSLGAGSGGGVLGFGNQAIDPTSGQPLIVGSGLLPARSTLPPGTRLESDALRVAATWRPGQRLSLAAEFEQSVDGDEHRRLALGGDVQLAERARLYGRFEQQQGWTSLLGVSARDDRARALVFGIDTRHLADTQLFSEYRLRDAISGSDAQLAAGARRQWLLGEGLGVSAALERIRVLRGSAATASAASVGIETTGHALWRAATRIELRRSADLPDTPTLDERFTTTLWTAMAARKLDRDWTLLARNHLLKTDYRDRGDVLQDRAQLGLAWRDTDTHRWNALGKVELRHERDASNAATGELRSRSLIVSTVVDHRPSRTWWMTGRWAAKQQHDRFEQGTSSRFRAQWLGGRLVHDVAERWDLGLAAMAQIGQSGARQAAVGVEAGWLLATNLWLSAGYNVTGFAADRDLSGYEYTQRGAYLRLRFKFDETLFKGADRDINRSLDR